MGTVQQMVLLFVLVCNDLADDIEGVASELFKV